jgi:hypothetical protein
MNRQFSQPVHFIVLTARVYFTIFARRTLKYTMRPGFYNKINTTDATHPDGRYKRAVPENKAGS